MTKQRKRMPKSALEPQCAGSVITIEELMPIVDWYNQNRDKSDARQYVTDYLREFDEERYGRYDRKTALINKYAWVARMYSRGANFDDEITESFNEHLDTLCGKEVVERIKVDLAKIYVADFEEALDQRFIGNFQPYSYFHEHKATQKGVRYLITYYTPILEEVRAALRRESKDLVEAYHLYTKKDLQSYEKRLALIVEDSDRYLGNVKRAHPEKKARTPRQKTNEQILRHFRYMKEHGDLKLASEDPALITGASAIYTLNTSNNIVTMFLAQDGKGLQIHRSSIANYDPETSKAKRAGRKLMETVEKVLNGTKYTRLKVLEQLSSDYTKLIDRTSDFTLILRIDK